MNFRSKLFNHKFPYENSKAVNELFVQALKENCQFHYEHCKEYRQILQYFNFNACDIKTYEDLDKLPFLPTLIFKKRAMFSMPQHKILITATSSGTKGQFSQIGFDGGGLLCGLKMVLKIGCHRKLFSPVPAHYMVLGYKPHKDNHTAVAKTAYGATFFTPALSRTYALKYENGNYIPDLDGVINSVVKHSQSIFPMRFMGFPSYTYFMLKLMDERGICLQLKKGSKIMLGGGWKQYYTEEVNKRVFYGLAKKVLDIEEDHIIEFYGAVEHPILYCDCKNHHFHVPVYSRAIVRDVRTLKPVQMGETGLVNLMSPMLKATPVVSVMTDDLGVLHDGKECGCGISSPYLEILGRVGMKDIKTCAAGAAETMQEVGL